MQHILAVLVRCWPNCDRRRQFLLDQELVGLASGAFCRNVSVFGSRHTAERYVGDLAAQSLSNKHVEHVDCRSGVG